MKLIVVLMTAVSVAHDETADGATVFQIGAGSVSGEVDLAILTVDAPPGTCFVRMRGVNGCGPRRRVSRDRGDCAVRRVSRRA